MNIQEIIEYPELLREIIAQIKSMEKLRIPHYELPSDSHIEEIAKKVIYITALWIQINFNYIKNQ